MNPLRERLRPDRAMTTITIRMPGDVVAELKRVAPLLGFSGCQPLIRVYIGQGLRRDVGWLADQPSLAEIVESLRRHGVPDEVISSAIAEVQSP